MFEIEDAEEDESYSFDEKWSNPNPTKPAKSFFGAQDNDMNEDDEYNFDFGKAKASSSKSKSPQWKADNSVRASHTSVATSHSDTAPKSSVASSGAAAGSIMDKAQSMLNKYNKPPPKRSQQASTISFDEDDISLDSSSESNVFQPNPSQQYEMSFSPPSEKSNWKSQQVRIFLCACYHVPVFSYRYCLSCRIKMLS